MKALFLTVTALICLPVMPVYSNPVWEERDHPLTGRQGHFMVLDNHRQKIVLFGGEVEGRDYSNETFEWDVTTSKWNYIPLRKTPPERRG